MTPLCKKSFDLSLGNCPVLEKSLFYGEHLSILATEITEKSKLGGKLIQIVAISQC